MRDKAGMKFDCIFEETLDFIDIDYTHLNKTIRYEQRPHGEWIPFEYDEKCNPKPLPKGSPSEMEEYWAEEFMCSNCGGLHHWRNFCPKCGADMRKEEGEQK